jgi:hypothetical protein
MMHVSERREVRGRGEVWAHWRYSDRDQRAMRGANLTPRDDTTGPGAMGYLLVCLFGVPALLCVLSSSRAVAFAVSGMIFALLPIALLVMYSERLRLDNVRDRLRAGVREVSITPTGLRVDKLQIALADADFVLKRVTFQRGTPAYLTFTSSHYHYSIHGNHETGEERVYRLPVPQGCEREALELVERFRAYLERPR